MLQANLLMWRQTWGDHISRLTNCDTYIISKTLQVDKNDVPNPFRTVVVPLICVNSEHKIRIALVHLMI